MSQVTIVEAENLLWSIDEKMDAFRELRRQLLNPRKTTDVEAVVSEKSEIPPEKEVVEETKVEIVENGLGYSLDQIHEQLDKLNLQKSRIQTAMWRFKSTEKFSI